MAFKPANNIQDLQYFGEFGGVNPSISDSSTYTFLSAKTMFDTFEGNADGCYLYSRHSSPSNLYLGEALAAMEGSETATVTASGMGAITPVLIQLCGADDHIVSSRTIYGGTYAFLKNFAPRLGINTTFVDITKLDIIEAAITKKTKVLYCESVSNPLLEVADIKGLAKIAKKHNLKLVVDNTFSPLSISPIKLGADIVIHSLTKFINGSSDTVGGEYRYNDLRYALLNPYDAESSLFSFKIYKKNGRWDMRNSGPEFDENATSETIFGPMIERLKGK